MNFFEFENNSGNRLNQMTRPDQNISRINPESRINLDSRINYSIRINSPIRPTFNIPLTRSTENIQPTRPMENIPPSQPTVLSYSHDQRVLRYSHDRRNFQRQMKKRMNRRWTQTQNLHRQIHQRHLNLTQERRKIKARRRKSVVSMGKMACQTHLRATTLILLMAFITDTEDAKRRNIEK